MRKTVFISSVMSGYGEFRSVAKKTVETMHLYPVMAEDFGARPHSPQVACLKEVRESEVYLGILGSRYSAPTREEFEEARSSGKNILILVEKGEKEPQQEEFITLVEEYVTGYHRASFSTADELRDRIIQALSQLLTAPEPDFAAGDKRLGDVRAVIRDRQEGRSNSWLWLALAPASQEQVILASTYGGSEFEDALVDPAFEKSLRLFDRKFGTDAKRSGGWLEARQNDPQRHGAPPARFLMTDRQTTLLYGTVISEDSDFSNSFRSYYIDPENVKDTANRFFTFADQFYKRVDPVQRVTAFSCAAYILGTDRHFATPPSGQIQSMSMPWAMSRGDDLLVVPGVPMRLRRNQLRDDGLGEEITALFREKFDSR